MSRIYMLGLCSMLFLGCSLAPGVKVRVDIPPLPAAWAEYPESPRYILSYMTLGNQCVELDVPPSSASVTVYMEKGNNRPLRVTPVFREGRFSMQPAGALFPLHAAVPGRIALSWEEGFLADLLFRLANTSVPSEHINATRMSAVIEEAGADDPWALDMNRIIQTLQVRAFRKSQVVIQPAFSVNVYLAEGRYLWNNPFFPPLDADRTGMHRLNNLYPGEHLLFPIRGGEPVRILINREGWFIFYPESVEYGYWSVSGNLPVSRESRLPGGRRLHFSHTARVPG